jgi:hypothetical protein
MYTKYILIIYTLNEIIGKTIIKFEVTDFKL